MKFSKKILFLFDEKNKKKIYYLLSLTTLMALLDTIGIASILPFISVLSNPSLIQDNNFLHSIFEFSKNFGIQNDLDFIFFLGAIFFFILVFSLIFKAYVHYFQIKFITSFEYNLSKRLIEKYLNQPYLWLLSRNSANIGQNILSEVGGLMGNVIGPIVDIISKGAVIITILILLIATNPKITIVVISVFIFAYLTIFYFINNFLKNIGNTRLINNELRFKIVSESFGASKEIKLKGLEKSFVNFFSKSAYKYQRSILVSSIIAQMPRYLLEIVAFGGILLTILILITQLGNLNNILPIITLYIFAGYRLLPAVQQIFMGFAKLSFSHSIINVLYNDLKNLKFKEEENDQNQKIIPLKKEINLKNIFFSYPETLKTTIKDISLNISAKTVVGVMGSTGSGKSTLIDILIGLLKPDRGVLEVDGQIITEKNSRAWQNSIGYVPQHIYLADDTISNNIAFGVDQEEIDHKLINNCSRIANLNDFVENELPKKYETMIGERGVKLSGGQRQRIGIARALYNKPQLLILDEATNALDNEIEKTVMDSILNLRKDITIIMIAHRLNTLKKCDVIFKFEKGRLIKIKKQLIEN